MAAAVDTVRRVVRCHRCDRLVAEVSGSGSTVFVACKRCGAKNVVR